MQAEEREENKVCVSLKNYSIILSPGGYIGLATVGLASDSTSDL